MKLKETLLEHLKKYGMKTYISEKIGVEFLKRNYFRYSSDTNIINNNQDREILFAYEFEMFSIIAFTSRANHTKLIFLLVRRQTPIYPLNDQSVRLDSLTQFQKYIVVLKESISKGELTPLRLYESDEYKTIEMFGGN